MCRTLALAYGAASYLVFVVSFLYAIGFVGNVLVPKSIDSGVSGCLPIAFIVDVALLGLFAVPHSIMARQWFKRWWTRMIPTEIERSTYVLVSSLLLGLLCWQWRPIPNVLWDVTNPIGRWLLLAVFWVGWAVVFFSTFLINHFDLFGLRQVFLAFSDQTYTPVEFKATFLYRWIRHPIMLGFLVAFWATPTMSLGHLVFCSATTAYVLLALQLEERDLVSLHGERYKDYQLETGMLLPPIRKP